MEDLRGERVARHLRHLFTISPKHAKLVFGALLLLSVSLALSVQRSVGNEFLSNRYTKPETYREITPRFSEADLGSYQLVAASNGIELWTDLKTTSVAVVDRGAGYVWCDVREEEEAFGELNATWKKIARSSLLLEFFDERGISNVVGAADETVKRKHRVLKNGVRYELDFTKLGISLSYTVALEGNAVVFRLNHRDISEKGKFYVASVIFAPFLGAVPADELDGYIFVPDGPGALIRFSKPALYLNHFEKRVYGRDYGIENLAVVNDLRANRPNDFMKPEPTVLVPVYGIVHGPRRQAYMGVVTAGAEYSAIVAYPSGVLSLYNWAGAKFIYRQKYLQPTSRSGAGIQVAQKDMNKFNAELRLHFLAGREADYVGMARLFRETYGPLVLPARRGGFEVGTISAAVSFIASDIEKRVVGYGEIAISTFDDIQEMAYTLVQRLNGSVRLRVIVEGWAEGGVHGNRISSFSVNARVGGRKALGSLIRWAELSNVRILFADNVTRVSEKQLNLRMEAAVNLSQSIVYEDRDNRDLWLYRSYFTNVKLASEYLIDRAGAAKRLGVHGLALKEYPRRLYGDLKMDREFYRSDALKLVSETLAKLKGIAGHLLLQSPNMYAWKYADGFFDVPMNSSQYLFETDTVPFLQIVLSGAVELYSPYVNNGFFAREDVLKMIEYGVYPSFLLTKLDNYKLKRAPLWDYPSTKFDDWKERVVSYVTEVSAALGAFSGRRIVDRFVPAPGIVVVSYDNGRSLVINYTNSVWRNGGVAVNAKSWATFETTRLSHLAGAGGV